MDEKLIYRRLMSKEWHRLEPIFSSLDAFLPDSTAACAAVVENEQKRIVGLQMVQLVMHAEPHWEAPPYRGKINFLRLYGMVEPENMSKSLCAPGLVVVASTPAVEEMAKLAGYSPLPGSLWIKDLRKKTEAA